MKKKFHTLIDLLPALIQSFMSREMIPDLEEEDVIDFKPNFSKSEAAELTAVTNELLNHFFGFEEEEACYAENSLEQAEENPIIFWKSYLDCFYNFELIEDEVDQQTYAHSSMGTYMINRMLTRPEVNKRFAKRSFDGIHLADFKIEKDI